MEKLINWSVQSASESIMVHLLHTGGVHTSPTSICSILVLLFVCLIQPYFSVVSGANTFININTNNRREIPPKVLIGYASHNYDDNVRRAVMEDGVNIVIWAFMEIVSSTTNGDVSENENEMQLFESSIVRELQEDQAATEIDQDGGGNSNLKQQQHEAIQSASTSTHNAQIETSLDLDQIKSLIDELDTSGYSHVLHLVSFGGWNGPHLDPNLTAQEWYAGWNQSNASTIFHGIDWDLEGNDDTSSPNNVFTIECLDKMGEISQLMKNDGYIVSIAPPQSYLNFNHTNFSRYVNLTVPHRRWHAEFEYFGKNVYAHLLAKYGSSIDLISVQLYETYSDAKMAIDYDGMVADEYLYTFVKSLVTTTAKGEQSSSFYVDFSQDASLNMSGQLVELPLSKLVVGLANGWALTTASSKGDKALYISPTECKDGYIRLQTSEYGDLTPRGFMLWTLEERGAKGVFLAKGIGEFLNT